MTSNTAIPQLYFDGQFVDVLWDNYDNAVTWFETYFGWRVARREDWKVDPACTEGMMTQMDYGTWLVTYRTERRLPHHFADRGTAEAHVRVCFRVRELESRWARFVTDGVRVSPIYEGPKARYLDVWATPEGIRVTLQEDPSVSNDGVHPSWIRIGVRDVAKSIQWHESVTGMRLVEHDPAGGYAIIAGKVNHLEGEDSLWVLEQLPEGTHTDKRSPQVQPVNWIKSRE